MPQVNPEILKWARTTAGLSLADAAKGMLNDARGKTGAERLADLEAGLKEPSRKILTEMAKKYNRPLITFYLKNPPARSDRGQDFRTLSKPVDALHDANLDVLLRKVKASQEIVRGLLEDEEAQPLQFIGSASIDQKPREVADNIVATIGFDLDQFRARGDARSAFDYLRDKVEGAGIFVILAQNLGSHHTNIPLEIFRGFVIADDIAPFVVINDYDAESARSFTLLHELAHLWLGTTGVSGDIRAQVNNVVEKFCNEVAALILLPQQEINELRISASMTIDEVAAVTTRFADERNISRSMVAYKLLLDRKITGSLWQALAGRFYDEWREIVRSKKDKEGQSSGGPSYYVVRRSKLGRELTGLASRALSSGSLTPSKASIVLLGVKPGNVHKLLGKTQPRGNG